MISDDDKALEPELEPLCKELWAVVLNQPAEISCPALLLTCVEVMCAVGKVDVATAFRDLAELCTAMAEEKAE